MQYGGLLLDLDPETFGRPIGTEDCLYLNIWRPGKEKKNLPVFSYNHGGLNVVGEGATSLYHGANLAKKADMIVITFNYRLGIFGAFVHEALQTGDPLDDSGNYGFLDIIKALQWVQQNISFFGGDKDNVTIAGESAGAFNVVSLLASPLARGCFHRAVSISPMTSLYSVSMQKARKQSVSAIIRMMKNEELAKNARACSQMLSRKSSTWTTDYLRSKAASELTGMNSRSHLTC